MCYLLVIAAPESASAEIATLSVGELSTWPESNDSISAVLPPDYQLHAVGVGHHCSCGCVKPIQRESSATGTTLALAFDAAKLIEMAVHAAGQLALIAHWTSTELQAEEFQVAFGPGLSCFMLSQPWTTFQVDELIWVAAS